MPLPALSSPTHTATNDDLKFRAAGSFKLLCLSDCHYQPAPDPYSHAMIETLIRAEQPDLVIVNGDAISGRSIATTGSMRQAADNVAAVMEQMGVRWAITLGNHEMDNRAVNHVDKARLMSLYEVFPHNVNRGWTRGLTGAGNKCLPLWDAAHTKPLWNLWLIDSGAGSSEPGVGYDWIHADQIHWYQQTSFEMEQKWGRKIPGLMFFHIPLPEFREMALSAKVIGERQEQEGASHINSGLFSAILERGDVRGIICGHDHSNNYLGTFHGVALGYDAAAGFLNAYPHLEPGDPANGRVRGGRVVVLNAAEPGHFKTWMRFHDGSKSWEASSAAFTKYQGATTD